MTCAKKKEFLMKERPCRPIKRGVKKSDSAEKPKYGSQERPRGPSNEVINARQMEKVKLDARFDVLYGSWASHSRESTDNSRCGSGGVAKKRTSKSDQLDDSFSKHAPRVRNARRAEEIGRQKRMAQNQGEYKTWNIFMLAEEFSRT